MARRAQPYTVFPDTRTGLAWLNTAIGGQRVRRPLGVPYEAPDDPEHHRRLAERAAEVFAEITHGRILDPGAQARVQTTSTLRELLARFLADDANVHPASSNLSLTHCGHVETFTDDLFRGFAGKDGSPKWKGDGRTPLERIAADDGPTEYVRERLRVVLKQTAIKEVSTLFRFFTWAKQHKHLASLPPRPEWPKKAIGVRSGPQRAVPVQATHEEMLAIIAAMPEWTSRGGRNHGKQTPRAIPVRDLARLAYETGLRPSTIARLAVPDHFSPGERRLFVPPEIDKGRNVARYVALNAAAAKIMEKHAAIAMAARKPLIFGKHDLRDQWKRAAAKVLPPVKAKAFSLYDFRHGAGRRMVQVSGGNLLGVAHQLGHKHLTTTNRYLAPAEVHGDAVVAAMDVAARKPRKKRAAKRRR